MGNLVGGFQERVKTSSSAATLVAFKAATGFFVGLTLALVGDQILDYGAISFTLVLVVAAGGVFKVASRWSWPQVFVFNLICVLIGLVLRMYILIAPG